MAWLCFNKSIKINKIDATKAVMVPGKIGSQHTDLMTDTGATMSMVPAKLINSEDYTGQHQRVRRAVDEESLLTTRADIEVKDNPTMITVLVTAEDTVPLLGTDYPAFMKILRDTVPVLLCQLTR